MKNLVAAIFRIEHAQTPADIQDLLALLNDWLVDRPDLRRMFALWIRAALMRKTEYAILLPQVLDLQELNVMLADKLEEWALGYKAEGIEIGMEKGMEKGEMLALQKLLTKRFGTIPTYITARIAATSQSDVDRWFDRAIDARQLADVFDNNGTGPAS